MTVQDGCGDERNEDELSGLVAISKTDAWAVGSDQCLELVEHWDGQQWGPVDVDLPAKIGLFAVDGRSGNNVWAVGWHWEKPQAPVVQHWNGRTWALVKPPLTPGLGHLTDVMVGADREVWVTGDEGVVARSSCS